MATVSYSSLKDSFSRLSQEYTPEQQPAYQAWQNRYSEFITASPSLAPCLRQHLDELAKEAGTRIQNYQEHQTWFQECYRNLEVCSGWKDTGRTLTFLENLISRVEVLRRSQVFGSAAEELLEQAGKKHAEIFSLSLTQVDPGPEEEKRQAILERFLKQLSSECDEPIANMVCMYHPVLQQVKRGEKTEVTEEDIQEILLRGSLLGRLQKVQLGIQERYPERFEKSNPLWNQFTSQILLSSADSTSLEIAIHSLEEGVFSLLREEHTPLEAEAIFMPLLRSLLARPELTELQEAISLRSLKNLSQTRACTMDWQPGWIFDSYQTVYHLVETESILAKYKPNSTLKVAREEISYRLDRALGFCSTSATCYADLSFSRILGNIQVLFKEAETLAKRSMPDAAQEKRQQAEKLCKSLPESIQASLLKRLGSKPTERDWCLAIQDFLTSADFASIPSHLAGAGMQVIGSLQEWITEPSERVFELLTQNPQGGRLLAKVPKAIVHRLCLLEMFKGSQDDSSGNGMAIFASDAKEEIIAFRDFDDERAMPLSNDYQKMRIWALGLPQADEPFDRSVLLGLLGFASRFRRYQKELEHSIESAAYLAFCERGEKIFSLLERELAKPEITLTPRELFFSVFGGRETFEGALARGVHPLRIFEYEMGEIGRGLSSEEATLKENCVDLFGVTLEEQDYIDRIKLECPEARVAVRHTALDGKSLYIRGEGMGLSWDVGQKMERIGEDLWVWKKDGTDSCEGVQYKVVLNDQLWETGSQNHRMREDLLFLVSPKFDLALSDIQSLYPAAKVVVRSDFKGGERLSIVGRGSGLSWDGPGEPLRYLGEGYWVWEPSCDVEPDTEYKIKKNGTDWESGDNHHLRDGVFCSPTF